MKGKGKGRMKKMKGHLICYILTQMPSCRYKNEVQYLGVLISCEI